MALTRRRALQQRQKERAHANRGRRDLPLSPLAGGADRHRHRHHRLWSQRVLGISGRRRAHRQRVPPTIAGHRSAAHRAALESPVPLEAVPRRRDHRLRGGRRHRALGHRRAPLRRAGVSAPRRQAARQGPAAPAHRQPGHRHAGRGSHQRRRRRLYRGEVRRPAGWRGGGNGDLHLGHADDRRARGGRARSGGMGDRPDSGAPPRLQPRRGHRAGGRA